MANSALGNLTKAAYDGVCDIVISLTSNTANKQNLIVLDPLTTLIRLALLPYKPENTKISVRNGTIEFDEPQLQGPVRTLKRSDREGLKELKPAIENVVRLYNVKNPYIGYIFRRAVDGLRCLLHVYNPHNLPNPNNVCNSIELYIQCLENVLPLDANHTHAHTAESSNTTGTDPPNNNNNSTSSKSNNNNNKPNASAIPAAVAAAVAAATVGEQQPHSLKSVLDEPLILVEETKNSGNSTETKKPGSPNMPTTSVAASSSSSGTHSHHYAVFKSLWSTELVHAVYLLLAECKTLSNSATSVIGKSESVSAILQAINAILDSKDEIVKLQTVHANYKPPE